MRLVEVNPAAHASSSDLASELEQGNILYLPSSPVLPSVGESHILRDIERVDSSNHKNIAYRPAQEKVSGLGRVSLTIARDVRNVMRSHSQKVIQLVSHLIPGYAAAWQVDYASFRPHEEEGRSLPWRKRNDLLHVDAFSSRPTRGDLILRVFTNIHPKKSRVWLTSEPFAWIAKRYAGDAGLDRYARAATSPWRKTLRRLLPPRNHTPYDAFMLHLHDYLKSRSDYQQSCPKYHFDFPPGSTWITFTDIVPHAVLSGQYALEQTFIVARSSLVTPESAPAAILEQLAGVSLTTN